MDQKTLFQLRKILDTYIEAAIQRVPHSGNMVHRFSLSAEEVLRMTGRERLHDAVISDVVSFFQDARVHADYRKGSRQFNLELDLNECSLNFDQSRLFNVAITKFRMDHDV
ncbi:hypothetical protein ACOTDN_27105 [Achromobacter xylosoxidans]|uniref:hypothetical protein n=1 Tax=Alcaligenes xylosoxydans xylosoxydans TaxID=85698 RepID=UPI0003321519|nr:hypothetical protein [Achromobacter xylosoxidans]MCH4591084.1 hypothetical protein [Achromobacter xylosoxidans]CCH07734.1 hypothetical protein NH44784_037881 [Achromobacter xylosoxidans NH44784-1996]CUJ00356.1 Uncharacterised protein [Achromobacter xylosoxidans]